VPRPHDGNLLEAPNFREVLPPPLFEKAFDSTVLLRYTRYAWWVMLAYPGGFVMHHIAFTTFDHFFNVRKPGRLQQCVS
jgi:hypothetical protein